MRRYLRQLGTFLAPTSVDAADNALRQLARWMVTDAGITALGDLRRDDVEDFSLFGSGGTAQRLTNLDSLARR